MCESVNVVGEDADEEEVAGRTWNNCEAKAKEEEIDRNVKDDAIEIRDETVSKVQRIKEEENDQKENDGKRREERSQQWFYQAIFK